nr:DNA-directed RNA polymerase subunit beta [Desulfobacterales bacterium]
MVDKLSKDTRIRKNFGKIKQIIPIPNLMDIQKESYDRFLQMDVPPEKREDVGLQGVFKSVFPIHDFSRTASLEFVKYTFGEIKYNVDECIYRGMTYEVPIRITVRLVVYDVDKETDVRSIRDIKEQEIYFGTIPLMTERGTFIINGTERVVVSQLHRSPGVFFDHDKGKTHASGKVLYSARIIPMRGSWIDMEIDPKDIVYVRIDRRRKFPVTVLLKAFGYTGEDLINYFYKRETVLVEGDNLYKVVDHELLQGQRASRDVKDPETGELIVKKGNMFSQRAIRQLRARRIEAIPIDFEDIQNKILARTLIDPETGETIASYNEEIDQRIISDIRKAGISSFEILYIDNVSSSDSIRKTLLMDKVEIQD